MQTWIFIIVGLIFLLLTVFFLLRKLGNTESAGQDRVHSDAKRFARLLVSQIKLYNEDKVERGRVSNDIYSRLEEQIDDARKMFDKRVDSKLLGKDYFDEEVVKELAGGDWTKMGTEYPASKILRP